MQMNFRQLTEFSIRVRIMLMAGACLVFATSVLVYFSLSSSNSTQAIVRNSTTQALEEAAQFQLKALATSHSKNVQSVLDEAYFRVQMLSENIMFFKRNAEETFMSGEHLREGLNRLVKETITRYTQLQSIFVVFEKDKLDQQDDMWIMADYIGSNVKGRFSTHWLRDDENGVTGKVFEEEEIINEEKRNNGEAQNAWLTCAKEALSFCLLEPYKTSLYGKEKFVTSLVIPLVQDDVFLGVAGVTIDLKHIQTIASKADEALYGGSGTVLVTTDTGLILGNSEDSTSVGSKNVTEISEGEDSAELTALDLKKSEDGLRFLVNSSIILIGTKKIWAVDIELPTSAVMTKAEELYVTLSGRHQQITLVSLGVGVIVTLIAIALIGVLSGKLVKPIKEIADRMKEIATGDGDLTKRIEISTKDEMGALVKWFNSFLDKLQPTIADVASAVEKMRATADEAADVASKTNNGIREQFSEIELVAAASTELATTSEGVDENASSAAQAAKIAAEASTEGKIVGHQTSQSIADLVKQISDATVAVQEVADESENINSMLLVIQDISEQTNLLALNAAIEAARAGEQGRGFAVVADEVRGLAGRTQNSIGDIKKVIDLLQSGSKNIVNIMDQSNEKANNTVIQVDKAVSALDKINESVTTINDMNNAIATAANEQNSVSSEINKYVVNIRNVSASISEQAEKSENIGSELMTLADHQKKLMDQFKT